MNGPFERSTASLTNPSLSSCNLQYHAMAAGAFAALAERCPPARRAARRVLTRAAIERLR